MLTTFAAFLAVSAPPIGSASDVEDDATITLQIRRAIVLGDARSWCKIRVSATGTQVSFVNGDRVYLFVYEDDVAGDDLIWQTDFFVESQDVSAQAIDRIFNCSADFGDDVGREAEIYASARVEKAECTGFCLWDRPATAAIETEERSDDSSEDNDVSTDATAVPAGLTRDLIARDADWFVVDLASPGSLEIAANFSAEAGDVSLNVIDEARIPIGSSAIVTAGRELRSVILNPGLYFIEVTPQTAADFNFFDLNVGVTPSSCAPADTETEPCGNCGERARSCLPDGTWDVFGPCEAEGICAPLEEEREVCRVDGSRSRVCRQDCQWGPFGECVGSACTIGMSRSCYEGSAETEGLGLCLAGTQACDSGFWGECIGQRLPTAEACFDGLDGDCDGLTDFQDPNCAGRVGDPCADDRPCADPLACLQAPEHPRFTGGYCGDAPCIGSCIEGVCAQWEGRSYCLKRCASSEDCRSGYVCFGTDSTEGDVCVPGCRTNEDCPPQAQNCDPTTFTCRADETNQPASPDGGIFAGFQPPVDDGGGCRAIHVPRKGGPMGWVWIWVALLWLAVRNFRGSNSRR